MSSNISDAVAQKVDQILDLATRANLMAASGMLTGLKKLEAEVIYRLLRRDIMQESTAYRSILLKGKARKQRAIALNFL